MCIGTYARRCPMRSHSRAMAASSTTRSTMRNSGISGTTQMLTGCGVRSTSRAIRSLKKIPSAVSQ